MGIHLAWALLFTLALMSCNTDAPPPENLIPIEADAGVRYQTIEGFGASNAWTSLKGDADLKEQTVGLLFSRNGGIGLSILRTRIPFRENPGDYRDGFIVTDADGAYVYREENGHKYFSFNWNSWEAGHTRELITAIMALGSDGPEDLTVMATPWTPPNLWKTGYPDSEKPAYGGTLDPAHYPDYADILADFALGYEAAMGEPLDAISVQNEPNYVPTGYESCGWTATQIRDFLKVLGPRFAQKAVPGTLRVMAAEGMHFDQDMVLPSLNDAEAAGVLDIVAVHQYDHDEEANMAVKTLTAVQASEKPLWQTEVSSGEANDPSISDGVYWAKLIHLDLTMGNVNAFLYWWLWSSSDSKGALVRIIDNETIQEQKRLYTMGQFSRFIRPGWKRIQISDNPVPGLFLSAFINPEGNSIAVVAVTQRKMETRGDIAIRGINGITSIETWRTDETHNLEQTDDSEFDGTSVSAIFPAQSVTTLVLNLE